MISERLKEIRKTRLLTAEDFATQIGVSYRAYTSYERGERKPPYEMLISLSNIYNVNLNWLIAGKGEMFVPPPFENVEDDFIQKVKRIVLEMKQDGLFKD